MIRGRFFDGSTASLQVMLIIFGGIVLFTLADIFLFADFGSPIIFGRISGNFSAIQNSRNCDTVGKVIDISASHCLQLLISHHTGMI